MIPCFALELINDNSMFSKESLGPSGEEEIEKPFKLARIPGLSWTTGAESTTGSCGEDAI